MPRERIPPVLRALMAQGSALLLLVLAVRLGLRLPGPGWVLAQGFLAALGARLLGLGPGWWAFQVLLPVALAWQLARALPPWVWPTLFLGLALIYGGGILTRVPLYLSRRPAWEALAEILEGEKAEQFADLGAGLGDPSCFLAQRFPGLPITGVEASPLTWLMAWLRSLGHPNLRLRLGSLWSLPLAPFQVVHAFLSPAPMPRLWAKACAEMRPGTLLVSHTFEIPGVAWEARLPLPGRPGAALLLYRIPSRDENQVARPPAEG